MASRCWLVVWNLVSRRYSWARGRLVCPCYPVGPLSGSLLPLPSLTQLPPPVILCQLCCLPLPILRTAIPVQVPPPTPPGTYWCPSWQHTFPITYNTVNCLRQEAVTTALSAQLPDRAQGLLLLEEFIASQEPRHYIWNSGGEQLPPAMFMRTRPAAYRLTTNIHCCYYSHSS